MDSARPVFTLTGFRESTGFRVFQFEAIAPDRTRTPYSVRADLAMARRYGIRLQDLPLLCRGVLDGREATPGTHFLTYSEQDMSQFREAAKAREELAKHRKPRRQPATDSVGIAALAPAF